MSREHWKQEAANWAAWARRPEFDAYWKYAPAFFELVPSPGRHTLDIGCGEGRVSRDLAARGHRVTAVDLTETLIRLAHQTSPELTHVLGDAAALPFADGAFDLVVLYNSLMDVDDMDGAVREASRVLEPGGRMCVCVTHPLADAGGFESREPDSPFVIKDTYLGPRRWLEAAGLSIEALREPPVNDPTVVKYPSEHRWRRIPNFLMWRAVKT